METTAKRALCRTSLLALGTAFELVSQRVPELQAEIAGWEEGRTVSLGVAPAGPHMRIRKRGARIVFLGMGLGSKEAGTAADTSILFKNLDSAVMVFAGLIGSHEAVAENRVSVHGSNHKAMEMTRAMAIVQTYLFPDLMLKRTFKRPPKLTLRQLATKAGIYASLVPALAVTAWR